jgi:hypothetical protein
MSNDIGLNIDEINSQISQSCLITGRNVQSVQLLAVSKTKPVSSLLTAYDAGQKAFGENYLQEALEKITELPKDIEWHFIGSIQSKKIKLIAQNFKWIHTLDRLKVVDKLVEFSKTNMIEDIQVCLQVNIDNESTKSGFNLTENKTELLESIAKLQNAKGVSLRGLMCIPNPEINAEGDSFKRLKYLLDELNDQLGLKMDTLSMGMSNDMHQAILAGSTIVRVGTAIFGQRNYK